MFLCGFLLLFEIVIWSEHSLLHSEPQGETTSATSGLQRFLHQTLTAAVVASLPRSKHSNQRYLRCVSFTSICQLLIFSKIRQIHPNSGFVCFLFIFIHQNLPMHGHHFVRPWSQVEECSQLTPFSTVPHLAFPGLFRGCLWMVFF